MARLNAALLVASLGWQAVDAAPQGVPAAYISHNSTSESPTSPPSSQVSESTRSPEATVSLRATPWYLYPHLETPESSLEGPNGPIETSKPEDTSMAITPHEAHPETTSYSESPRPYPGTKHTVDRLDTPSPTAYLHGPNYTTSQSRTTTITQYPSPYYHETVSSIAVDTSISQLVVPTTATSMDSAWISQTKSTVPGLETTHTYSYLIPQTKFTAISLPHATPNVPLVGPETTTTTQSYFPVPTLKQTVTDLHTPTPETPLNYPHSSTTQLGTFTPATKDTVTNLDTPTSSFPAYQTPETKHTVTHLDSNSPTSGPPILFTPGTKDTVTNLPTTTTPAIAFTPQTKHTVSGLANPSPNDPIQYPGNAVSTSRPIAYPSPATKPTVTSLIIHTPIVVLQPGQDTNPGDAQGVHVPGGNPNDGDNSSSHGSDGGSHQGSGNTGSNDNSGSSGSNTGNDNSGNDSSSGNTGSTGSSSNNSGSNNSNSNTGSTGSTGSSEDNTNSSTGSDNENDSNSNTSSDNNSGSSSMTTTTSSSSHSTHSPSSSTSSSASASSSPDSSASSFIPSTAMGILALLMSVLVL